MLFSFRNSYSAIFPPESLCISPAPSQYPYPWLYFYFSSIPLTFSQLFLSSLGSGCTAEHTQAVLAVSAADWLPIARPLDTTVRAQAVERWGGRDDSCVPACLCKAEHGAVRHPLRELCEPKHLLPAVGLGPPHFPTSICPLMGKYQHWAVCHTCESQSLHLFPTTATPETLRTCFSLWHLTDWQLQLLSSLWVLSARCHARDWFLSLPFLGPFLAG